MKKVQHFDILFSLEFGVPTRGSTAQRSRNYRGPRPKATRALAHIPVPKPSDKREMYSGQKIQVSRLSSTSLTERVAVTSGSTDESVCETMRTVLTTLSSAASLTEHNGTCYRPGPITISCRPFPIPVRGTAAVTNRSPFAYRAVPAPHRRFARVRRGCDPTVLFLKFLCDDVTRSDVMSPPSHRQLRSITSAAAVVLPRKAAVPTADRPIRNSLCLRESSRPVLFSS